ncbi:hypothetical protein CJ226_09230 [Microbacterium sp. UMB0228]|nr:hypothetical protein CJ226_09230 [Microbacterium sp. UMB0228]
MSTYAIANAPLTAPTATRITSSARASVRTPELSHQTALTVQNTASTIAQVFRRCSASRCWISDGPDSSAGSLMRRA